MVDNKKVPGKDQEKKSRSFDFRIKRNKRDRYYVLFLTKEGSIYRVAKKKKIKPSTQTITSNRGVHVIDTSKISFRKKSKYFICFDTTTNSQLGLICFGDDATLPPDMLKELLKKSVIKQLASLLMGQTIGSILMWLIVGCVAGVGIGWILKEMMLEM